jgi:DNA processing protein
MVKIRQEWASWLALKMVRGIGNVSYRELLVRFGSPESVFAASFTDLINTGSRPEVARGITTFQRWNEVEQELQRMACHQVRVITWAEPEYPDNLRQIHDPPPFFYVKGGFLPQDRLAIALVGSRAASRYGREVTRELAAGLAEQGITVVSGLARGIDAEAHKAALAVKRRTVAVLGSGLDIIYPSEHKSLAEAIAGSGAVVSEFGMGSKPEATNFPYRNRVISGLTLGTVVVEATEKSGSLITAQCALDQGREVFAVPGDVSASRSRGTNRLIKEGAKLVENMEDILSEIAPVLRRGEKQAPQLPPISLAGDEENIFRLLADEQQVHVDTLITKSGLSPARVLEVLLELELRGLISQLPGKYFAPTIKLQAKA